MSPAVPVLSVSPAMQPPAYHSRVSCNLSAPPRHSVIVLVASEYTPEDLRKALEQPLDAISIVPVFQVKEKDMQCLHAGF